MSAELLPSSQGNRRAVLISTGSNKRGHLLGYFISRLFICMRPLQEAPSMPPKPMAGGEHWCLHTCWDGTKVRPCVFCPIGSESLWLRLRLMVFAHSVICRSWAETQSYNRWGEISQVDMARGIERARRGWQLAACSLPRCKEPSSVNNGSNQSESRLATCLHDIFLSVHDNRDEFSGCVWRWRFQRFCKKISYTFQLEKELIWKRGIQSF